MTSQSGPTSSQVLLAIAFVISVTAIATALQAGILRVGLEWPQTQSGMPPVGPISLGVLSLAAFAFLVASRRSARPKAAPPATGGQAAPTKPGRVGLVVERPATRFADVAGAEEAKEELSELVDFLRRPERFHALGARLPRGVLLVGPPGNGKTLLARAVAGEAGVAFLRASGSDFVEMYVGVGASRVRQLFASAREHERAIIFVDEIDAVGRKRGGPSGHSHEEREQTLNQLLVEMDGFDPRTKVVVIAATNRADVLDPALLRPGRFDRQVRLDPPDAAARRQILALHARGKPLAEGIELDSIIGLTAGLSGADLENLLNEAAILAARGGRTRIEQHDLEEALDRVVAGPRRKGRAMSERERRVTAVHELGHALVAHRLPEADPVRKVTIVSRGQMGGYTRMTPEEDRLMWSLPQFEAAMASALGGQVAEALVFGRVTTGASNDLRRAAAIARAMVCDYGMSPVLGSLAVGSDDDGRFYRAYGERLAERIDAEVERLIGEARLLAEAVLRPQLTALRAAAEELLEVETLGADDMTRLFGPRPALAPPSLTGARPIGPASTSAALVESASRRARRRWRPTVVPAAFSLKLPWRRQRQRGASPTLVEA